MDEAFSSLLESLGVTQGAPDFVSLSLHGMQNLEQTQRSNGLYGFAKCVERKDETLCMLLDRMPFGLIEYQINFLLPVIDLR